MKINPYSPKTAYAMMILGVAMIVSIMLSVVLTISMVLAWQIYPFAYIFYTIVIGYNITAWLIAEHMEKLRNETTNKK